MELMDLTTLQRQFLEYLEIEKGRSLKTVLNYDRYLTRLFGYLKAKTIRDVTDESVRQFRLWLNRQRGMSGTLKKNTQNYYLIALRAFLKYLQKRGVGALGPERIELARTTERELELISRDELLRLLAAPDPKNGAGRRARAMFELLFSTGLRVSELCALRADTIDLKKDEFTVRGKGEKVRLVFLSPPPQKGPPG